MCSTRPVEPEVGLEAAGHDLIGNEVVEHEDIRLLDDLRPGHPFRAEQNVGGDRDPWRDILDDQWLESCEAVELLVDPGAGIVSVYQGVGELQPKQLLMLADVVGTLQRRSTPKVPTDHDVRICIVVD